MLVYLTYFFGWGIVCAKSPAIRLNQQLNLIALTGIHGAEACSDHLPPVHSASFLQAVHTDIRCLVVEAGALCTCPPFALATLNLEYGLAIIDTSLC